MTTIDAHSSSKTQRLPQINGKRLFVTDGGLETELVFHYGIDLPGFAAFPLLDDSDHRARLRRYYDGYLDIARELEAGFIVETPTWRANPNWGFQLGYSPERLDADTWRIDAIAQEGVRIGSRGIAFAAYPSRANHEAAVLQRTARERPGELPR